MKHKRHKQKGMTLSELLVAMAIFSVVSLVTLEIYLNAYTEFEHSSGTMTLSQRARTTVDRITMIMKTACPVLINNTEAFVHPNSGADLGQDLYETDFISSICWIRNSSLGTPAWPVNDPNSAAYVADATDPRYIYETDQGLTAPVTRQPSLYRFRIAWNYLTTPALGDRSSVPARAVYLERLKFADGSSVQPEGPNRSSYFLNPTGAPWMPDTGDHYSGGEMRPRLLGKNVHSLTFRRTQGNVVLMRIKLYNRDPETNQVVEGLTMRRPGHGGERDAEDRTRQRYFVVDLTTNIQLPTTIGNGS